MTVKEYMSKRLTKMGCKDFEFIFEPTFTTVQLYTGQIFNEKRNDKVYRGKRL